MGWWWSRGGGVKGGEVKGVVGSRGGGGRGQGVVGVKV